MDLLSSLTFIHEVGHCDTKIKHVFTLIFTSDRGETKKGRENLVVGHPTNEQVMILLYRTERNGYIKKLKKEEMKNVDDKERLTIKK